MNLFLALFITALVGVILVLKHFVERSESSEQLPYRAKKYFFTRSEKEFLRVLNDTLDHNRYLVFPKVRLADFIEVTASGRAYQGWWNKIRSKHVDFLIWDMQQNKIALAIELDGNSHESERMKERDVFVDELYEKVRVRLERARVGTHFGAFISKIASSLAKED